MNKIAQLRLLHMDDALSLATVEQAVFADGWDAAQFSTLLAQEHFLAVGAWHEMQLLGYISAYNIEGEMEIVNVAVRADQRRQGLGRGLLQYLLQVAQTRSVERIFLEVRVGNKVALTLYTQAGFRRVGLRKGYYADTGEDALVLAWANPWLEIVSSLHLRHTVVQR